MGKTIFRSKKISKQSKHRVTSKNSKAKQTSPTTEASPERSTSSMAGLASTNPPNSDGATYDPCAHEQVYTPGPYSQTPVQDQNTASASNHHIHFYRSVQNTNYVPAPSYITRENYEATNIYHQTSQPQSYTSYPTERPSTTDVFYTYEESCTNSFAMSEYPTAAEPPTDQYQECSPQLQTWAEETSNTNLPVNERLVRSNWE